MREINFHILPHSGQASVERISKIIPGQAIGRIGFLPHSDLVCKPDIPSLLHRLTQLFTLH